jgi:hypothetical protein
MSALREEAVGLREALDAQRTQLERHYAGLHAKMRKEYEQVSPLVLHFACVHMCAVPQAPSQQLLVHPADDVSNVTGKIQAGQWLPRPPVAAPQHTMRAIYKS